MVRHVNNANATTIKAICGILAASGILLWHLLACIESPMAFSPGGKELAFVTMEPYDLNEMFEYAGSRCYRLMVLSDRTRIRVIEQTTEAMLTAPAYSPDGRRLCYLRIPLPTPGLKEKYDKLSEEGSKALAATTQAASKEMVTATETPSTTSQPGFQWVDRSLPPLEKSEQFFQRFSARPPIPAELVVRDASSFEVVERVPLRMFLHDWKDGLRYTYVLSVRPQFSPDGRTVYVCLGYGGYLVAVNLEDRTVTKLVGIGINAILSPDGKTIATISENWLAFISVDGQRTTYLRWTLGESEMTLLNAMAWVGNDRLAILKCSKDSGYTLHVFKTDGTESTAQKIPLNGKPDGTQIAVWGKRMVISQGNVVYFMKTDGKILSTWNGWRETTSGPSLHATTRSRQDDMLIQPTFSPDGNEVAFKFMAGDESRATAIVTFTPEGKEISRAEIPAIKPGTTRPASGPASQPGP